MPHDSPSVSDPVPLSLGLPVPTRADLMDGLVRPVSATVTVPLLELDRPDADIAAFLAGIAHADTGFVARTDSAERALAIVAATAAALCGDDIRTALTSPDVDFLRGLPPPAIAALREVLLAVESDSPDALTRGLAVLAP
ncbi:hypothetical protein [Nocardia transvalensis]|uniref:hypothetical protein n=1 Tax=Nocardia transvalensis TaxID=37333 RepID=UPI0018959096|nr:hypothetical protein [Nocardia transvalensis]MBF6328630.1 hypothetical protein [Nocardia transvalensis]